MAIYFNGGFRETEQMVYDGDSQGVTYLTGRKKNDLLYLFRNWRSNHTTAVVTLRSWSFDVCNYKLSVWALDLQRHTKEAAGVDILFAACLDNLFTLLNIY